jgi:thiamine-phosphate pyrophosphorylase
MNKIQGYYFITDENLSLCGNVSDVKAAIRAGVSVVQYRDKQSETGKLYDEALALRKICRGKALFIVNDRIDVALAVEADGVHLGQLDMPYQAARRLLGKKKIIGVTAHDLKEALEAWKMGADYLGVSPIFSTTTKLDAGIAGGVELIKKIRAKVKLPLVAIGGITLKNAPQVIAAGADSICAISAVVNSRDPADEMRKFQKLFNVF